MTKVLALILTLTGMAGLILGVIGISGKNIVPLNAWAVSVLGLIFFTSGIGLLKKTS